MDYSDGPMIVPRPCDRCGTGNIEYVPDDNKITNSLCAEVQMAFGLIAWLCHDCRKQWHVFIKNHKCSRQMLLIQLELEFWKARIGPDTNKSELSEGLRLLNIVEDLEIAINNLANEWLIKT